MSVYTNIIVDVPIASNEPRYEKTGIGFSDQF